MNAPVKTPANWIFSNGPFSISEKGGVKMEMVNTADDGAEDGQVKTRSTFLRSYHVLEFILNNAIQCRELIEQAKQQETAHVGTKTKQVLLKKLNRAGLTLEQLEVLLSATK